MKAKPRCVRSLRFARKPLQAAGACAVIAVIRTAVFGNAGPEGVAVSLRFVLPTLLGMAALLGIVLMLTDRWMNSRWHGALIGFGTGAFMTAVVNFAVMPVPLRDWRLLVAMVVIGIFPFAGVGAMYWPPLGGDVE